MSLTKKHRRKNNFTFASISDLISLADNNHLLFIKCRQEPECLTSCIMQCPQAHIVFKPNLQQQRKCDNCTGSTIDGVFTVKYDVNRDSNAGELQVSHTRLILHTARKSLETLTQAFNVSSRSRMATLSSSSLRPTSHPFLKTSCSSLTSVDPCGGSR